MRPPVSTGAVRVPTFRKKKTRPSSVPAKRSRSPSPSMSAASRRGWSSWRGTPFASTETPSARAIVGHARRRRPRCGGRRPARPACGQHVEPPVAVPVHEADAAGERRARSGEQRTAVREGERPALRGDVLVAHDAVDVGAGQEEDEQVRIAVAVPVRELHRHPAPVARRRGGTSAPRRAEVSRPRSTNRPARGSRRRTGRLRAALHQVEVAVAVEVHEGVVGVGRDLAAAPALAEEVAVADEAGVAVRAAARRLRGVEVHGVARAAGRGPRSSGVTRSAGRARRAPGQAAVRVVGCGALGSYTRGRPARRRRRRRSCPGPPRREPPRAASSAAKSRSTAATECERTRRAVDVEEQAVALGERPGQGARRVGARAPARRQQAAGRARRRGRGARAPPSRIDPDRVDVEAAAHGLARRRPCASRVSSREEHAAGAVRPTSTLPAWMRSSPRQGGSGAARPRPPPSSSARRRRCARAARGRRAAAALRPWYQSS